MTRLLLFIKHKLPIIWRIVELLNGSLFKLLHRDRLVHEASRCFDEFALDGYQFRPLGHNDLGVLFTLLENQREGRLDYFKPHGFDYRSLERVYVDPAFLMFGVFHDRKLVGYFSLRCFWNRRAFVGRLIDEAHEGKGIGRVMNNILYNTAWRSNFRCHTTISKRNAMVMRSHSKDPNAKILKELPNDYLLIEFVRDQTAILK